MKIQADGLGVVHDRRLHIIVGSTMGPRTTIKKQYVGFKMLHRLLKSLIPDPLPIDEVESIGDFIIPANDTILCQLHKFRPTYSYSERIKEIRERNAIIRQIDGHPDLHDYLWERAGEDLPCDARWIVRAQAAFAYPDTKVIFAIASGTHSIQIKIPVADMATFPEIKQADPTPETGAPVWVKSRLNETEDKRLLQIAYDAAGLTVS